MTPFRCWCYDSVLSESGSKASYSTDSDASSAAQYVLLFGESTLSEWLGFGVRKLGSLIIVGKNQKRRKDTIALNTIYLGTVIKSIHFQTRSLSQNGTVILNPTRRRVWDHHDGNGGGRESGRFVGFHWGGHVGCQVLGDQYVEDGIGGKERGGGGEGRWFGDSDWE